MREARREIGNRRTENGNGWSEFADAAVQLAGYLVLTLGAVIALYQFVP